MVSIMLTTSAVSPISIFALDWQKWHLWHLPMNNRLAHHRTLIAGSGAPSLPAEKCWDRKWSASSQAGSYQMEQWYRYSEFVIGRQFLLNYLSLHQRLISAYGGRLDAVCEHQCWGNPCYSATPLQRDEMEFWSDTRAVLVNLAGDFMPFIAVEYWKKSIAYE